MNDERRGTFSAEEFARLEHPPCPVCGTSVEFARIDVTLNREQELREGRRYIVGPWCCPHGCNPITGERMHSQSFGVEDGDAWFKCMCGTEEHGVSPERMAELHAAHRP